MRTAFVPLAITLLIAGVVAAVYTTRLDYAPIYLAHDEVQFGRQAYSLRTTGRDLAGRFLPLYFAEPGFNIGRDPVMIYATAALLYAVPFSESSVRLAGAIVGTIDVVLVFLLARRLLRSEGLGAVAALILALAPAHFIHSRLGVSLIFPLPFVLAWLLFLAMYVDTGKRWTLAAALGVLGLGIYSYLASVILMPLYLALSIWVIHSREAPGRSLAAAGAFLVPLVPFAVWELAHPRYAEIIRTYHPYAARFTPLQGAKEMLSYFSVSTRAAAYWDNLSPSLLFLTGDASLINSTREAGAFLWPVGFLFALGVYQILTERRTRFTLMLLIAFVTAPLPAVVTADIGIRRELVMLPFGALIASYGVEFLLAPKRRAPVRLAAVVVLLLLPFQFRTFYRDYMGDNRTRTSLWFGGNVRGALEDIIDRRRQAPDLPVYLSTRIQYVDEYWSFYLLKHKRPDLIAATTYFDPSGLDPDRPPPGTLLASTSGEAPAPAMLAAHGWQQVASATEPNGVPTYLIFEKQYR